MPPLLNKTTDQRIVHHGTWEQFKFIQKGFEGSPGVRLFYDDGAIKILMPGQDHETFARVIGYLVTTFLDNKHNLNVSSKIVALNVLAQLELQSGKHLVQFKRQQRLVS